MFKNGAGSRARTGTGKNFPPDFKFYPVHYEFYQIMLSLSSYQGF